jgi:hypothetical protein
MQDVVDYTYERLDQIRKLMEEPETCFCTGACRGNPQRCPVMTGPRMTFQERVEERAIMLEASDPRAAKALRKAARAMLD